MAIPPPLNPQLQIVGKLTDNNPKHLSFFTNIVQVMNYMSKDWVIDRLITLGLLETQARIYLLLLIHGSKSVNDIAQTLSVSGKILHRNLGGMSKLSIIKKSNVTSVVYSAIPLTQVFSQSIEANEDKLKLLEKRKQTILQIWRGYIQSENAK